MRGGHEKVQVRACETSARRAGYIAHPRRDVSIVRSFATAVDSLSTRQCNGRATGFNNAAIASLCFGDTLRALGVSSEGAFA